MKVSIVIPTKNRANILQRSLSCALNQTSSAHEIIVADNNSTDNTKEVIESFNDPRIIHLHTSEDMIITENWIRGIKAASGDWIKIIYDDDWIEDDFLEKTTSYINDDIVMIHTGGIIHVTMVGYSNNQPPQFVEREIPSCVAAVHHNIPAQVLLAQGMLQVNPVGGLIKKSAIDYAISVMPMLDKTAFESGIGPDVILLYAATTKFKNAWIHIPEVLAHYDGRHGSLTIKTSNENPDLLTNCYVKSFDLLDQLWLENNPGSRNLNSAQIYLNNIS
jgi:glycosyltransferase involved in cell wall biosynthesis